MSVPNSHLICSKAEKLMRNGCLIVCLLPVLCLIIISRAGLYIAFFFPSARACAQGMAKSAHIKLLWSIPAETHTVPNSTEDELLSASNFFFLFFHENLFTLEFSLTTISLQRVSLLKMKEQ